MRLSSLPRRAFWFLRGVLRLVSAPVTLPLALFAWGGTWQPGAGHWWRYVKACFQLARRSHGRAFFVASSGRRLRWRREGV